MASAWLPARGAFFGAGRLTGVRKDAGIARRTGADAIASHVQHGFMLALAIGEIGVFVVLLYGFVRTLL